MLNDKKVLVLKKMQIYWDFSTQSSLHGLEKKKTSSEQQFSGLKSLLMLEVRGVWPEATVTQLTTHYSQVMQKITSEHTTYSAWSSNSWFLL